MKTFSDLKVGDRIYCIDHKHGIHISEIWCIKQNQIFNYYIMYLNSIIGNIGEEFRISEAICNLPYFVNTYGFCFADENKFLERLKQVTKKDG